MRTTLFCSVCLTLYSGAVVQAQVTSLSGGGYDNGVVPNTITNDLSIDFSGQYTGSQLFIELTAGSIYQDAIGSDGPPNSFLFGIVPSLEFDSFVANGSEVSGGPFGEPAQRGGAVNLGGGPAAQFDASQANYSWFPAAGNIILDQSDFITARITLSDDAEGTWSYMASANGTFGVVESMPISNGFMMVDPIGDYDDSGVVGAGDLDIVLLNWGTSNFPGNAANLPGGSFDGAVSQNELNAILLKWGNSENSWRVVPEQIIPPGAGGSGDFDQSGQVGGGDLDLVLLNWGTNIAPGVGLTVPIDQDDLDKVLLQWGSPGFASTTQAVPEPTSLILIGVAIVCGFVRRFS